MKFQKQDFYQNNIADTTNQIKQLSSKINRFALLRLAVILLGGYALFEVVQSQQIALTLFTFIIVLVLFFWMVSIQSKLTKSRETFERFMKVNENELAISKSRTNNIYDQGEQFVDDHHLYSSDLDIYGDASLFQLVNRASTIGGIQKLSQWFGEPSTKQEIEKRQEFVKELSSDFGFWQQVQTQLLLALGSKANYKKRLEDYLLQSISVSQSSLLRNYVKVPPFLMLALFVGSFFSSKILALLIIAGIVHFLLGFYFKGKIDEVAFNVDTAGKALSSFSSVFKSIEDKSWQSQRALELLDRVREKTDQPVSQAIKRLSTLIGRLDMRLNMFVGILLNVFLLWDLRQVFALEEWRKTQSLGIPEAFDLLSEFEAVGSLATLNFNQPEWAFPVINDSDKHYLECTNLAHPFIKEEEIVPNNYSLKDHRLALITGSNMAGKSTFLRTVGINSILAYAGAPVYASSMELSVMQMVTYMRIRDSINENTSTFKAELNRIKQVLEEVEIRDNTFFLLDEMLRGTNSVDKYLGSKAIIEKLIANKGVGMVATHDLKLADLSDVYPGYVKNFHFDIQVHGEEMLFDYLLKNGPCTIFNASLLLKKIGIHI